MEAPRTSHCRALLGAVALAATVLACAAPARAADGPAIVITSAPPAGAGEDTAGRILGRVSGVDPKQARVIVYAHTDLYYVQPMADRPYTRIGSKLTWKTTTHRGWDYAALLVRPAYRPAAR